MEKKLPYTESIQCVQCGYCLPACPTYLTMGKETHSPRGRINLVKLAAEGQLNLVDIENSINLCLGCRACETACPSGVEYGRILEETRYVLTERQGKKEAQWMSGLQNMLFQKIIPHRRRMGVLAGFLWFYQETGLQKMVQKSGLIKIIPENLRTFEKVMPKITSPVSRSRRATTFSPSRAKPVLKIGFFTGCIMDAVFERINRLSMELLALAGCEVYVIKEQTCCGALHAHAGREADTIRLAKQNIASFEQLEVDYIVNNAGGCGALLKEYQHLFHDDVHWQERAQAFVDKVRDISQILAICEFPFAHAVEEKVTYQPSCHMTNVQKITEEPLALIKKIPGVMYKEMKDAGQCCASAGIYNLVHYHESMDILDGKMKNVQETEAHTIVTTNPGCLLQMKVGIERAGLTNNVRAVHLVELLAESVGLSVD